MQKAPFNVRILDPDEFIQEKNCQEVTSFAMYTPSSTEFDPSGLFSEQIFGQIGSTTRLVRKGFISLNTTVITPHLYKQIISLKKSLYNGILKGETYAVFDNSIHDFVRVESTDPKARTGYAFFVEHVKDIEFVYTNSAQRANKIKLIDKYKDRLFIDKYIVLPAGIRDVRIKNGRPSSEAINKLYLGLLSLSNILPPGATDSVYDQVRYQIQLKVVEIYDYIFNLMDGKKGFALGKYTARAVAYSNRNVITAAMMNTAPDTDSKRVYSIDELEVPLFQAMKGAVPLVVNRLRHMLENVFDAQNNTTYLIDKDTLETGYYDITDAELRKFTTSEGLEKIINDFRNPEVQKAPVTVEVEQDGKKSEKYVFLVYDDGDIITILRNINDFKQEYAKTQNYRDIESLSVLDTIGITKDDYVVEGSAACYAFGFNIAPRDIDIIVNDKAYEILKKLPPVEVDEFGDFEVEVSDVKFHIKRNCHKDDGMTFDKIQNTVVMIGDHRYISPAILARKYNEVRRIKDIPKIEFFRTIVVDETKIRPMTYVELCYLATSAALVGKHVTATRYPVLEIQSLAVYKVHLMSTAVSRKVTVMNASSSSQKVVLPEYPKMDSPVRASLSVHPATLKLYNADHDGDTMTVNFLLSEEANTEIENYLKSNISMLNANGGLIYGIDGAAANVKMAMTFLTFNPV